MPKIKLTITLTLALTAGAVSAQPGSENATGEKLTRKGSSIAT